MADASIGSIIKQGVIGDMRYAILPWTPGATVAAGGESALTLIKNATGIADVLAVIDMGVQSAASLAYIARYDDVNGKIQYFGGAGAVTAAAFAEATGNLAASVTNLFVLGK